jgi:hypothetical protein
MTPHEHSVFAIIVGLIIMVGVALVLAHGVLP